MDRPHKIVLGWSVFFFCVVTPMFLFSDVIKQNEVLTFLFVGTTFCMMFISPLVGLWFLNATRKEEVENA